MTSLINRILKGTVWAYASVFSSKLIVFLANAWLVRLLSPQEFGLRHMALIVIGLFEMLQSLGVNEALIYQDEEVEKTTETVFLINLGLGAAFSAVTISIGLWAVPYISGAGFIARLLGESNVLEIKTALELLPILGMSFFILSIGRTHETLLQKRLDFQTRFWPQIISAILRSAVAVVLALMGYGVMSLVWSYIVGCVVRSIFNWIVVPYRPKFRYYPEAAREVWQYGGKLTLFNLVDAGFTKIDEIVIGAGLGSTSLGFYGEAQRIPDLLILNLNVVLTNVLFPAYSGIKDNLAALKRSYEMATKYMTLLVMPIALGLYVIAPDFVTLYFGPGWELVTPLLQWLSMTMLWLTMAWNVGDVIKAIGRPGLLTRLLVVEAAVNLPLLLGGAYLDLKGITGHPALGATIGSSMGFLFGTIIRLGLASRLLDLTFREILNLFYEAMLAGGVMMLGLVGLSYVLPELPALVSILVNTLAGGVLYLGMLWLVARKTLTDAGSVLANFVKKSGKGTGAHGE